MKITKFEILDDKICKNRKYVSNYPEYDYTVELRVTDNCNLSCEYCFWHYGKQYKHEDIKICIDFIFELAAEFNYKSLLIYFHGGEPSTHKNIIDIFKRLKSNLNVKTCLEFQTNLTMKPAKLKELCEWVDLLCVSLHYNELHNVKGMFDRFNDNINFLNENNIIIHNLDIMLEEVSDFDIYYEYIRNILSLDIVTNSEMIYNYWMTDNINQHKQFYDDNNITERKYNVNGNIYTTNDMFRESLDFRDMNCSYITDKIVINGNGDIHWCDTSMTQTRPPIGNIIEDKNIMIKIKLLTRTGITCRWDECVCYDTSRTI